nr:MAG: hypothetical protein DIU55_13990 [Bacillota bacterium]
MTGNQKDTQPSASGETRRYRVRRVRRRLAPRDERDVRELTDLEDDADRGTPEQDAALQSGCMSMVRVVGLFFVVMILSIIATWFFR